MTSPKRIIIASLSGLLFGFVCLSLAWTGSKGNIPTAAAFQIVASRTLIGVAIGISCLRLHWSLHGLLLGALFSVPLAISGLMAPDNPQYSKASLLVCTIILGAIYGLLTELITSVLFKARRIPTPMTP